MLFLERARFIHIGAPDCRIDDLTISAQDDGGRPVDSVIWLRNGGGKTVLLSLFFAHLLPGVRDFLKGKKENARFSDHVLDGDTSYVAARWVGAPTQLSLTGDDRPRLVTGRAVERRAGFSGTALPDLFFSFRPVAGVLDLDSLPWAADGHRLDLSGFLAELNRLSRAHPALDLVTTEKDGVWAGHLRRQGLDPEIVRYQLQMNAGEGEAATGFMKFRTSDEFVDFVVGVVTPREALDTIEDEIRTYAAKLRRLPEYRCELELIERALPALRAHAGNLSTRERLEEERQTLLTRAAKLRAELNQAQTNAVTDAADADAERKRLDAEAEGVRKDRNRLKAQVQEAVYLVAVHRFEVACRELREAAERCRDRKRDAEDWGLSEPIAQQRSLLARQDDLQKQLADRQCGAEPSRLAAERAGSALSLRLQELASVARQEVARLRQRVGVEDERSKAAWREAEQAKADLERIKHEVGEATRLLDGLEHERGRLRANGSLADGETGKAAVQRLEAEAQSIDCRLSAIAQRLKTVQNERADLAERRRDLATERERLDGERKSAEERIAELSRERDVLWRDSVLTSVCEVAQPDLWDERGRLETALERRAQELSTALVGIELSAAADRRSRAALESSGHLPPAVDVERALEILAVAGIRTAYPGWEYLRRMRDETASGVLISAPELAGGILLNDPEEIGPALSVLEASDVHPTSVVALGLAEEVTAGGARTVRLWQPHPALFDREAGEAELARLGERLTAVESELAEVRCRLDAVRDSRLRLLTFYERWPAGTWAALHQQVTALAGQVSAADKRAGGLAKQDESLAAEVDRQEAERACLLERSKQVPGIVVEIRGLAASEALEPGWRAAVADSPSRTQEAANRRTDREVESREAEQEANRARDDASRQETIAEQWEKEAGGLPSGVEVEPGLTELPVEALRGVWEQRERAYRQELGAESITASLDATRQQLRELDPRTRAPEAQLERVRTLLTQPDGATAGTRLAALRRAEAAHSQAVEMEGGKKVDLQRREAEREAAEGNRLPLGVPLSASSLDGAYDLEERYREEDREAERRENSLNSLRGQAQVRSTRARERAAGLLGQTDTLAAAADLAEVPDSPPYAGEVEEAREAVAGIVAGLKQTATEEDRARTAAAGTGRRLRQLAEAREYQRLGPKLTARVGDPGTLAGQVTELAAELELRLAPLRADIETAETDRRMVVGGLVKAVKDAFRDLRRIGEASRLPEGLDAWTGEPFVRIHFDQPRAEDELELRVGGVVEDWVNREQVPARSGLAILRQALRRANTRRPAAGESGSVFGVTLLKPDAILTTQRYAVEAMKFSEGQDLTTAILLYSAFVNHRVQRQGDPGGVAGVLLLDNPIGKASLEQLIKLQRTVATVMGVQLIATTGVRDREAISHYPKVIGIRPVRSRDGRRKYLVANDDPMGDAMVAAELVARHSP